MSGKEKKKKKKNKDAGSGSDDSPAKSKKWLSSLSLKKTLKLNLKKPSAINVLAEAAERAKEEKQAARLRYEDMFCMIFWDQMYLSIDSKES